MTSLRLMLLWLLSECLILLYTTASVRGFSRTKHHISTRLCVILLTGVASLIKKLYSHISKLSYHPVFLSVLHRSPLSLSTPTPDFIINLLLLSEAS